VQQLYRIYRKTGIIPTLRRPGRPKVQTTEHERRAIKEAYDRFRMCACYLEKALSAHGVRINQSQPNPQGSQGGGPGFE